MSNKNKSEKIAQLTIDLEIANAGRSLFEMQVRLERERNFFLERKLFEKEEEIKKLQSDNSKELLKIIQDLAHGANLQHISQNIKPFIEKTKNKKNNDSKKIKPRRIKA